MVKRIRKEFVEPTALANERSNHIIDELAIAAAVAVGPFVTAFCTELGRRFGGTSADWAARVRTRRAKPGSVAAQIEVAAFGKVTILEIIDPLTDEAKLALLDLNIQDTAICGQILRWNAGTGAWEVVGGRR